MFSVSPSKSQDEEDEERSDVKTEGSGSFVCIIVKAWSDSLYVERGRNYSSIS